ncbi:Uncharacterised protein g6835 [Pycnogonum litorale]
MPSKDSVAILSITALNDSESARPNQLHKLDSNLKYEKEVVTDEKSVILENAKRRKQWSSKTEFMLACVGLTVGSSNLLYFPGQVYRYGRAAFLIQYIIILFSAGIPLYFLQLAIAQFCGAGPVSVWKCVPAAKGIGVSTVIHSVYSSAIIIGFMSGTLVIITYSTINGAHEPSMLTSDLRIHANTSTWLAQNVSLNFSGDKDWKLDHIRTIRMRQFVESFDLIGNFQWPRIVSSAIILIIMFFVVMHGSRGIGSIVYYTATLPFMFIIILIVRACSLDGAMDGLKIFCTPDWSNLLNIKAWESAAATVMGSLGLTSGSVIVYGSYNKFRNNCLVDAFTISLIDFGTSVMSCLIFFPAVGNMADRQNLTTDEVLSVEWIHPLRLYLSVISYLPSPTLWSVIFSITICLLYIDTIFGLVETVVSALVEEITWLKSRRKSVCLVVCVVLFLIGIPFSTKDSYALRFTILYPYKSWISIILSNCFVLAILWGYGVKKFSVDIEFMLRLTLPLILKICWVFVCPVLLLSLLLWKAITLAKKNIGTNTSPTWETILVWNMIAFICILPILCGIIYSIIKFKSLLLAITPEDGWGPSDPRIKRQWYHTMVKRQNGDNVIPLSQKDPLKRKHKTETRNGGSVNVAFIEEIMNEQ